MRKLLFGIIILITLITAFIAFIFYHEQSSGELVGRSVALEWATEAVGHGAGELLVTSIDRHGTGLGFDIELYQALAEVVDVTCNSLWWCWKYTAFCGFIYKDKCDWSSCRGVVT